MCTVQVRLDFKAIWSPNYLVPDLSSLLPLPWQFYFLPPQIKGSRTSQRFVEDPRSLVKLPQCRGTPTTSCSSESYTESGLRWCWSRPLRASHTHTWGPLPPSLPWLNFGYLLQFPELHSSRCAQRPVEFSGRREPCGRLQRLTSVLSLPEAFLWVSAVWPGSCYFCRWTDRGSPAEKGSI